MQPTIDPEELAQWLGFANGDRFICATRGLIKTHCFPRKLPGVRRWSRKAVLQWIERQGGVDPAMAIAGAPVLEPDDMDFDALRRDIEARYMEAAE